MAFLTLSACFIADPNHVLPHEVGQIERLIETLQLRQTLLSEITILSEDSLCPICYAKSNSAAFDPCQHQSCEYVQKRILFEISTIYGVLFVCLSALQNLHHATPDEQQAVFLLQNSHHTRHPPGWCNHLRGVQHTARTAGTGSTPYASFAHGVYLIYAHNIDVGCGGAQQ